MARKIIDAILIVVMAFVIGFIGAVAIDSCEAGIGLSCYVISIIVALMGGMRISSIINAKRG